MSDKTYTVQTLAEAWQCSTDTVYGLLTSGKLLGFKLGAAWRITEAQKLAYETESVPTMEKTCFRGSGRKVMRI